MTDDLEKHVCRNCHARFWTVEGGVTVNHCPHCGGIKVGGNE